MVALDAEAKVATLGSGARVRYDALVTTQPLDVTLRALGQPAWADQLSHRCGARVFSCCCARSGGVLLLCTHAGSADVTGCFLRPCTMPYALVQNAMLELTLYLEILLLRFSIKNKINFNYLSSMISPRFHFTCAAPRTSWASACAARARTASSAGCTSRRTTAPSTARLSSATTRPTTARGLTPRCPRSAWCAKRAVRISICCMPPGSMPLRAPCLSGEPHLTGQVNLCSWVLACCPTAACLRVNRMQEIGQTQGLPDRLLA